jgi:hypothetical protein
VATVAVVVARTADIAVVVIAKAARAAHKASGRAIAVMSSEQANVRGAIKVAKTAAAMRAQPPVQSNDRRHVSRTASHAVMLVQTEAQIGVQTVARTAAMRQSVLVIARSKSGHSRHARRARSRIGRSSRGHSRIGHPVITRIAKVIGHHVVRRNMLIAINALLVQHRLSSARKLRARKVPTRAAIAIA